MICVCSNWNPLGQTIWVYSPSRYAWSCIGSFFPQLWQHVLPHLGSLQRREQINFEKLFQKGYMTIPFPTSFLTCLWIHFKHTWGLVQKPSVGAWLSICLVIPCFLLPLDVFSSMLWTELGLPQLWVVGLTHYTCDQPIDPMEIHLFHRAHGGERTTSHDVVQDTFASIAKDARFQVL
jgi:hypothetical protein